MKINEDDINICLVKFISTCNLRPRFHLSFHIRFFAYKQFFLNCQKFMIYDLGPFINNPFICVLKLLQQSECFTSKPNAHGTFLN